MKCKLIASLLLSALACAPAYADRSLAPRGPRQALAIAPERVRAPYDVTVLGEDGSPLETFAHRGRYYVLGNRGERYIVRITNPTAQRVEAVVSVDGLDVIDGESGDLRKRGYIVQPYGEVRIEGFRTSTSDVATFRFSSVGASYAGRKGKARNVGVVAVAVFAERAAPPEREIVIDEYHRYRDHRRYRGESSDAPAKSAPAPSADARSSAGEADHAPRAGLGAGSEGAASRSDDGYGRAPESRPGLGTEFGEQRYSAVSYTRFVRASDRPVAIAELRYNNASGLMALGIPIYRTPDDDDLATRESADPFPGDHRFARPPAGIR
jgi:hypothetical protein